MAYLNPAVDIIDQKVWRKQSCASLFKKKVPVTILKKVLY